MTMKKYIFSVLMLVGTMPTAASDIIESSTSRYLNTNPVLELAVEHLKTLRSGDILKAYSKLSSYDFKSATSLQDFIEMVKATPQLKHFEGISLNSIVFEEDKAVWQGSLHDKYGLPLLNVTYAIVNENDKWVIETMQASPYSPNSDDQVAYQNGQPKKKNRKHYLRQG